MSLDSNTAVASGVVATGTAPVTADVSFGKTSPRFLTATAVIAMTGVPRASFYKIVRAGEGPKSVTICGRKMFLDEHVEEWINHIRASAA
ncbi:helix-turn-helix transcriptional regulator [Methylocystis sp. S23]